MSRDYRDRLLDAAIEKLRAQKNTRPLGDALAAERTRLQNVERAGGLWSPEDRAEILSEFAGEAETRLRARGQGAKPPSHLVPLRGEWAQVTRCIASVFKTAPAAPAARTAYVRASLEEIWRFILARPKPAPAAVIDYVLDAHGQSNMAFRMLARAYRWPDPEKVRRALGRDPEKVRRTRRGKLP